MWEGTFGDDYTDRNRVDWGARVPFWREALSPDIRSVLEVGCNAGWNLMALREIDPTLELRGIDVNEKAVEEARENGLTVAIGDVPLGQFDLVFTSGVLIHISPDRIIHTMMDIINASTKYVMAIEYASDREEEIEYRGLRKALWKRPFGLIYETLGLELIRQTPVGQEYEFDDCVWWAFRK